MLDSDSDHDYDDSEQDDDEKYSQSYLSDSEADDSDVYIDESDINEFIRSNQKIYDGSLLTVKLFNLLFLFITHTFGLNKIHSEMLYKFILILLPGKNNCPKSFYLLLKNSLTLQPKKVNQYCKKCEAKKEG